VRRVTVVGGPVPENVAVRADGIRSCWSIWHLFVGVVFAPSVVAGDVVVVVDRPRPEKLS
jgi:hypothetical protein